METQAEALQCTMQWQEQHITWQAPLPQTNDQNYALHLRRSIRRLCRQTLYQLCRELTGIHPPWGSLTGIRPTHLLYEALQDGLSL